MSKKDPWAALGQPRPTYRLKLTPEAVNALREYNLKTTGRGVTPDPYIRDPQVIERLGNLSMPGETPSDVILRVFRQGGVLPQ
jgi:hypothetical protein